MRIVRTVNDLKQCIYEIFENKINPDLNTKITDYIVDGTGDKQQLFWQCNVALNGTKLDMDKVAEFRDVVFQLNDYRQVLKGFVELLLFIKHFEHVSVFFSRIFVAQVGNVKYRGSAQNYTIEQRYFDRFIECIKFCDIPKEYYIPYFLAIFRSGADSLMFIYKDPLKEFLDTTLKDGENDFIKLLIDDNNLEGLEYFLRSNTAKTLEIIMNNYLNGNDNLQNLKILLKYKQEIFNSIEGILTTGDDERIAKVIHLLLEFKERQVNDRLVSLMKTTESPRIRSLLERELGFMKSVAYGSEQEFITAINTKVTKIQERLYGARLKGYFAKHNLGKDEFESKAITFVMETIKSIPDETIYDMYEYFKYLPRFTLQTLAEVVYEISLAKDKLANSKWAIRLICLFADKNVLNDFALTIKQWFANNKKHTGATYFIYCLGAARREEFVEICKNVLKYDLSKKDIKYINKCLSEYSSSADMAKNEIEDSLVDDFGIDLSGRRLFDLKNRQLELEFDNDLNIKITNVKTQKAARISDNVVFEGGNLKAYIKSMQKEVRKQTKRFYKNFLENRVYTIEGFNKYVMGHNLLRIIAERVIWGKYRNDKLLEVFRVQNGEFIHLSGSYVLDGEEYDIALLNPLDVVGQMESVIERYGSSVINQLRLPVYNVYEYAPSSLWVDSFSGFFCNAKLFIVRLQKLGYRINDLDAGNMYSVLAKENKNLDLLTVVQFDKVKLGNEGAYTTTISKIMFYKLSQLTKERKRYILSNDAAIMLGEMSPKILNNEIAQIHLSCKN